MNRMVLSCVAAGLCWGAGLARATPPLLGTSFTYQGSLNQSGVPVNSSADFRFTLFDNPIGGSQIGGTATVFGVAVSHGLFTTPIDFGADVFDGGPCWMQIEVRSPAGSGLFIPLSGRQPISATPYALQTRGLFTDSVLRVGVGTATPSERLTVNGNLRLDQGDLSLFAGGKQQLWTVGGGRFLFTRNATTLGVTNTMGTSSDGSGFFQTYSGTTGSIMALLEGDLDQLDDAVTTGGLLVRSEGVGGQGGQVVVQNNDGVDRILLTGGVSGGAGSLVLKGLNGSDTAHLLGNAANQGGELEINNENGGLIAIIQPDFSGDGAYAAFKSADPASSLVFEGSITGSNKPRLDFFGPSPVTIDQTKTGDSSVQLPVNAISSSEILDEPGVANIHVGSVALGTSTAAIASRSITVPGPGYVLVLADGDLQINHTTGTTSSIVYGVSTSPTALPTDQDMQTQLPSGLPTATYDFSASAHGLFAVANAGTFTYYFDAQKANGSGATMFDIQLTLLYFPTAYGAVVSNLNRGPGIACNEEQPRTALSYDEIADEQASALDLAQARMAAEMQQMQVRIAQMQARLSDITARQQSAQRAPAAPAPRRVSRDPNVPADQTVAAPRQ